MKPYIVTYRYFPSPLKLMKRCGDMQEACSFVRELHTFGVETATITDKDGNVVVSKKDNIFWAFASSPVQEKTV